MAREASRIEVPKVSVISPTETASTWRTHRRENSVQLYLSGAEGDAAALLAVFGNLDTLSSGFNIIEP